MLRVTLIGTGRVATRLAVAIAAMPERARLVQLYGRHEEKARLLSGITGGVPFTSDKSALLPADLYLCAVKDDAIADAVGGMDFGNGVLAHTAGSVPMDRIKQAAAHTGVFYPLQTFSTEKEVDFSKITAYIEANDKHSESILLSFANALGCRSRLVDSERRARLHLAAVFACNFTNHLFARAQDALADSGLPFEDLLPLIDETVEKVRSVAPRDAQTGPARRKDTAVLARQRDMLQGKARDIYETLSQSILEYYD